MTLIKKEIIHSLARLLCEHAQAYNYDHGPNPTIDFNVGACPRHTVMAQEIIGNKYDIIKDYDYETEGLGGT